ncbi:MAG: hypothetical protein WCK03_00725 [Candidatus Taylorbacteria bacterium]
MQISDDVVLAIENWITSVGRMETGKQKVYFRSPHNIFEIWIARIPDPDSNKGSSGGFRLVYFLNIPDNSVFVDKLESRSAIGFKDERPRDKQKFQSYLADLKQYLLEKFDGKK